MLVGNYHYHATSHSYSFWWLGNVLRRWKMDWNRWKFSTPKWTRQRQWSSSLGCNQFTAASNPQGSSIWHHLSKCNLCRNHDSSCFRICGWYGLYPNRNSRRNFWEFACTYTKRNGYMGIASAHHRRHDCSRTSQSDWVRINFKQKKNKLIMTKINCDEKLFVRNTDGDRKELEQLDATTARKLLKSCNAQMEMNQQKSNIYWIR